MARFAEFGDYWVNMEHVNYIHKSKNPEMIEGKLYITVKMNLTNGKILKQKITSDDTAFISDMLMETL